MLFVTSGIKFIVISKIVIPGFQCTLYQLNLVNITSVNSNANEGQVHVCTHEEMAKNKTLKNTPNDSPKT